MFSVQVLVENGSIMASSDIILAASEIFHLTRKLFTLPVISGPISALLQTASETFSVGAVYL